MIYESLQIMICSILRFHHRTLVHPSKLLGKMGCRALSIRARSFAVVGCNIECERGSDGALAYAIAEIKVTPNFSQDLRHIRQIKGFLIGN